MKMKKILAVTLTVACGAVSVLSTASCAKEENIVRDGKTVNVRINKSGWSDEYFTACLDIGHAEMRGVHTSAVEMIKALGPRLGALHVHDNDLHHDSHQIPFSMQIDFDAMVKALREVDYKGDMTLECDCYLHYFCQRDKDRVFEGVQNLANAAKKLVEMFKAQ